MKVTAIFDIGKTNKKFFLFDENYKAVHKEYIHIDEIKDEDGDNCDDLKRIEEWVKKTIHRFINSAEFSMTSINFSSYGASFVHINEDNRVLTPLYNYLKPYPKDLLDSFYTKHGDKLTLAKETASPPLQMLNSGLQLYYLKYAKPEIFSKIKWSMHLPQYLSFLISGMPLAEYTSIGCHTMLWDYENSSYHDWVYKEGIENILPPIVETSHSTTCQYAGKEISVGVGIHDSSAALIPYTRSNKKPFALVSTGTWSITLNTNNNELLTQDELESDCLHFLQPSGNTVRASRLFLGNEYKIQTKNIQSFFQQEKGYEKEIKFNSSLYLKSITSPKKHFKWSSLPNDINNPPITLLDRFTSIEEAHHQLMYELVQLQINSINLAIGQSKIFTLYIDGGFSKNELYFNMLCLHFKDLEIKTSNLPLGSALGAALVINESESKIDFMERYCV